MYKFDELENEVLEDEVVVEDTVDEMEVETPAE